MDFFAVVIFYIVAIVSLCAFAISEALDYLDHIWKCTGYWDGKDQNGKKVAGPTAKCTKCGLSESFHWADWHALPANKKIELKSMCEIVK